MYRVILQESFSGRDGNNWEFYSGIPIYTNKETDGSININNIKISTYTSKQALNWGCILQDVFIYPLRKKYSHYFFTSTAEVRDVDDPRFIGQKGTS